MCTSTFQQCSTIGGATFASAWSTNRPGSATIRIGTTLFSQAANIVFRAPAAPGVVNTALHGIGSIYADAPRGVLMGSGIDTFVVKIYANVVGSSSTYTLFSWGIAMDFVPSRLSFVSITSPDVAVFIPPTVTLGGSGTTMAANTQAANGASEASRRGTSVHIATITMTVAESPTTTAQQTLLLAITNLRATFLVNTANNQFATDSVAHVYDAAGVDTFPGGVHLALAGLPVSIGLHAYPSPFHATIAPGASVSTAITVTGIVFKSLFGTPSDSSSSSATTTTAMSNMNITFTAGPFTRYVSVRVYFTTGVKVQVSLIHALLNLCQTRENCTSN